MSTIFIAIALITAALAILTVLGALLVLGGVVAIRSVNDRVEGSAPLRDARSAAPTQQLRRVPTGRRPAPVTLRLGPDGDAPRDDSTAAFEVGRTAVRSWANEEPSSEGRPTEMFSTNAGNFSELIDDVDDRR